MSGAGCSPHTALLLAGRGDGRAAAHLRGFAARHHARWRRSRPMIFTARSRSFTARSHCSTWRKLITSTARWKEPHPLLAHKALPAQMHEGVEVAWACSLRRSCSSRIYPLLVAHHCSPPRAPLLTGEARMSGAGCSPHAALLLAGRGDGRAAARLRGCAARHHAHWRRSRPMIFTARSRSFKARSHCSTWRKLITSTARWKEPHPLLAHEALPAQMFELLAAES
ncbi:hypothetical protein Dimus_018532 [Dionaea muscipula]